MTPTQAPSEGPLNFEPPVWVHAWEEQPDGQIKVVLMINITGGAPPFTIEHEHHVVSQTSERDAPIEIMRGGCSPMVYNITVKSSDGQTKSHNYWIGTDRQPWCND
jgi:hypothetical protein